MAAGRRTAGRPASAAAALSATALRAAAAALGLLVTLAGGAGAAAGAPAGGDDASRSWLGGARVAELWPTPVWTGQLDAASASALNT